MLYIVATPIGNLKDITYRAIETLKNVSYIFAEDTRVTKKLLTHYEIETKLNTYHEHNKLHQIENIVNILKNGFDVALVTDAGMPCVSDPGYELVKRCHLENLDVTVLPGASSVITAVALSGLDMRRMAYEGFLPKKKGRQTLLNSLKTENRSIVILESPNRIVKTLKDIYEYLGNRYVVILRELTKIYEEVIQGTILELIDILEKRNIKGEIVLIVKSIEEEKKEERKIKNDG